VSICPDLPISTDRDITRRASFKLLVILIALSVAMGRFTHLLRPFDADGAMFIYMGKFVAGGGRWWHGLRDNKLPSVGLVTSICWRAFGQNWFAYVMLQTVLAVGGALLLGRIARRNIGPRAFLPTCLCAMVFMNISTTVFGGFQLETIQVFFAILAASAAAEALRGGRSIDSFVTGLAAATAAMLKPTGAAVAGAMWLAMVVASGFSWKQLARHALMLVAGALIPLSCVLIYLARTDVLGDLPAMLRETARYAAETPFAASDLVKPVVVLVFASFPIAVRGWVFRRDRDDAAPRASNAFVWFIVLWFALETIGAVAQRRMYSYHFFPIFAPLALIFGAIPRKQRIASYAGALVPACLLCVAGAGELMTNPEPPRFPGSDFILAHARPNDAIWNDNAVRLLIETDRPSASRFPLMFLFSNYDDAPQEYGKVLFEDFQRTPPRFIVLRSDLGRQIDAETRDWDQLRRSRVRAENYRRVWERIREYVAREYVAVARVREETIFERRDSLVTTTTRAD
jgi:hypothetical protein